MDSYVEVIYNHSVYFLFKTDATHCCIDSFKYDSQLLRPELD